MVIDETGGAHGVRDRQAILSLAELSQQQAFGKELYPSIWLKAAVYARNIIMNHPFLDGNKRTGMLVASVFLEDNGYTLDVKEGAVEKFALAIVKDRLSLESMAEWFELNFVKL